MTEFALALPLFLLLVFGMVDLGRGFYYYNMVANLAREGARQAIVAPSSSSLITSAVNNAAIGLDPAGTLTTSVITNGASVARGNPITVTVTYSMSAITPMIGQFIPNGLGVTAKSSMLIEGNFG